MKNTGKNVSKVIAGCLAVAVAAGGCVLGFGTPSNPLKKGWCLDNNGYEINSPEVERLISVRPREVQVRASDMEYYSFIHYGMNTFTGQEWGDGTEKPSQFCPTVVDTDQWVRTLKESGSSGVIFTAKHHDGFCLFPSDYTEHDIANSPYQNGKGDICKQMAESCKKYGMKLGFYLSPWDRHEKTYATDAYNDFFAGQLEELCTRYGEIFTFWFDGARAQDVGDWQYDFDRYYDIIHKLQPKAIIANCGPDVRWIGNEAGQARKSEWSVITSGSASVEEIMNNSQQGEEDAKRLQGVSYDADDRGSRELVKDYRDLIWYPAEADVSIHRGWFYTDEGYAAKSRTAKQLEDIYYKTVGGNALLLMNVPPTKDGVIADKDVKLLQDFKARLDKTFKTKLDITTEAVSKDSAKDIDLSNLDCSYKLEDTENAVRVKLDGRHRVSAVNIREDIRFSQRVEEFKIYAKTAAGYLKIYDGTVIGGKKICLISPLLSRSTDELLIVFTQSRSNPYLRTVEVFES